MERHKLSDGEISLYFGLQKGQKADLEVVALAALEWVAAVRAAALELDLGAQIRIEFVDANESSLRLNVILDWLEKQLEQIHVGSGRYPRLRKLAIALAIFVALSGQPEFSAKMEDKRFLAALLRDHVRERLRVGIPMTLRLAVKETKVDGVWQQKSGGRSVIEVISPKVE